jgi:hypothetical protein
MLGRLLQTKLDRDVILWSMLADVKQIDWLCAQIGSSALSFGRPCFSQWILNGKSANFPQRATTRPGNSWKVNPLAQRAKSKFL